MTLLLGVHKLVHVKCFSINFYHVALEYDNLFINGQGGIDQVFVKAEIFVVLRVYENLQHRIFRGKVVRQVWTTLYLLCIVLWIVGNQKHLHFH